MSTESERDFAVLWQRKFHQETDADKALARVESRQHELEARLSHTELNRAIAAEGHQSAVAERDALKARLAELTTWAQQVTDALDGRPLPPLPDHSPARI